ncbi:MAG: sugar phosphate isomerase/epimerase family protein [Alsobacter sp.]
MSGKLGVHALVFTDQWDEPHATTACRAAAEIGFDLIEVLMFDPYALDLPLTRRAVRDAGIELRLGMALVAASDISSDDPDVARRGEATVGRALEIASDLGAPAVSGITYAAFANYAAPPTAAQRERVVASLARLDRRAGELGVKLGLEPVNRYESYMVNTLDEAAAMIRDAGAGAMFVHMDTFHMNIEEGDIAAAIRRNAALLGYAHVADSNRGALGGGHFDMKGFFCALADAGYAGDYTVESFTSKVLSPALVGGVRLWREAWADPMRAARTALEAMRSCRTAAGLAIAPW